MGMIGALQSLNYHASTADDFGAPAPRNPSATPDPQVHRRACTHINRRATARLGLTRAQTRTPVALDP